MKFCYLDEFGNSGNNLLDVEQPIHFISAIYISEDKMLSLEASIKKMYEIFLPHSKKENFEFHGVSMFQRKGYFKNFSLVQRLKAFEDIVKIAEDNSIILFCQGIHKKRHYKKYTRPYNPHEVAFMYLVEKLEGRLEEDSSSGLIIMDKCSGTEQRIINNFRRYKNSGTGYGYFSKEIKHFIENVLYVESHNSLLLQMADVLGYIHSKTKVDKERNNIGTSYHDKLIYELDKRIAKFTEYDAIDPN